MRKMVSILAMVLLTGCSASISQGAQGLSDESTAVNEKEHTSYALDTNSIPFEDEEETTEIQYEVISISDNIDCMVWDQAISSDAPAVITGDPSVETKGGIKISLIKDSPMKYHIEKDDAGTISKCELTDIFFSATMEYTLLDEERVGIRGHINPALDCYVVYSIAENAYDVYYGIGFSWVKGELYYVETAPLSALGNEAVSDKIMKADGEIVYVGETGNRFCDVFVIPDSNYMCFTTDYDVDKKSESMYIVDLSSGQTEAILSGDDLWFIDKKHSFII